MKEMLLLFLGFVLGTFGSWIASYLLPSPSDITNWCVNTLGRFANWRAKRSVLSAQRRMQSLEHQLENDKSYIQNTTSFVANIARDIMKIFQTGMLTCLLFVLFSSFLIRDIYTKIADIIINMDIYEPKNMIIAVRQAIDYPSPLSIPTKIMTVFILVAFISLLSDIGSISRQLLRGICANKQEILQIIGVHASFG